MIRIYRYLVEVEGGTDTHPWPELIASGEHRVEGKWSEYQARHIAEADLRTMILASGEFEPRGMYAGKEMFITVRLLEVVE